MRRLLILPLILSGLYLRSIALDRPSYVEDELFHVHAALSLNATGEPTLPGGFTYSRALPFTWLVAAAHRALGESEGTSRLPSVLLGTLLIFLTYELGRRLGGDAVGLIAGGLAAVSPYLIMLSRFARMYALHQCLYLIALLLFHRCYEDDVLALRARAARWIIGCSVVLLNLWVHPVAAVIALGFLGHAAWRASEIGLANGPRAAVRSNHGLSAIVLALAMTAAFAVPGVRREIVATVTFVPEWARASVNDVFFYRWFLKNEYGPLYLAAAAGAVWLVAARRRSAAFLLPHVVLPFLAFTLLPLKQTRYAAHLFPLYLILMAAGVYALVAAPLRRWLGGRAPSWTGAAAAAAVTAVAVAASPGAASPAEVREGRLGMSGAVNFFPWRDASEFVRTRARPGEIIVSSRTPTARYYIGRVDYSFDRQGVVEAKDVGYRRNGRLADYATGTPFLEDTAQFMEAVGRERGAWLILQRSLFKAGKKRISDEEREVIETTFQKEFESADGTILVFHRRAKDQRGA